MTTPAQRSLARLRGQGYMAAVVEKWNSYVKIRQDLFGVFDIVAVRSKDQGVLAVQCTTASNITSREKKILDAKVTRVWLEAGNRIQVHGWAKRGARGKRKTWSVSVLNIERVPGGLAVCKSE